MENAMMQVRMATPADRRWIRELRHRVYADELGQYAPTPEHTIVDDLEHDSVQLVVGDDEGPIGFVSLTPPWVGRFRLDHYVSRSEVPVLDRPDVFEVRVLTVEPDRRAHGVATILMYAALRWIASRGGRTIVAMGRSDLVDMYRTFTLAPIGHVVRSGSVDFEVMTADVATATTLSLSDGYREIVDGWRTELDWTLDATIAPRADGCEHGGASFTAIGTDFADLDRRRRIVAADVLDAWFAPAPAVERLWATDPGWLARTSPPTDAGGLVAAIAAARDLPAECLSVGAGSSDLIFRAFTHWLDRDSRVLLMDPGYGEYAHVTERVVGCHVDRFTLRRDEDWRIDTERLRSTVAEGRYDLVVVVNPNNPTGRHLARNDLRGVIEASPADTRWWVDEAYIGYVDLAQSLAPLATRDARVVVCTSLSKMYALSGARAAFLTAIPEVTATIRRLTPPWQVSLPAQTAAVAALADPEYYRECWQRTHDLREDLAGKLAALDIGEVDQSVSNFLNLTLPPNGPSAAQFVQACRADDVYVRDLSPLSPGYEGRTVRIAVRDAAENDRIIAACASAT